MAIACILTSIATFVQAFAPPGQLGAFMAGRVIIGFGIGMAISKCNRKEYPIFMLIMTKLLVLSILEKLLSLMYGVKLWHFGSFSIQ